MSGKLSTKGDSLTVMKCLGCYICTKDDSDSTEMSGMLCTKGDTNSTELSGKLQKAILRVLKWDNNKKMKILI